jgi:hypothetical protein
MSQVSLPPDRTDELLSKFFKSKMPHPWPAAPAAAFAQPSSLRATAGANRARLTLAASVALLLGVGWYLASGTNPSERGVIKPAAPATGILNDGSAKTPKEFDKVKKPAVPMLN